VVLSLVSLKRSDHNSVYFDPPFERTAEGLVRYRKSLLGCYPKVPLEESIEIAALMLEAFEWNWLAIARAVKLTANLSDGYFTWAEVEKRVGRFKWKASVEPRGDF
jgi:hypothetical protein